MSKFDHKMVNDLTLISALNLEQKLVIESDSLVDISETQEEEFTSSVESSQINNDTIFNDFYRLEISEIYNSLLHNGYGGVQDISTTETMAMKLI